jgi:hypothetical protein
MERNLMVEINWNAWNDYLVHDFCMKMMTINAKAKQSISNNICFSALFLVRNENESSHRIVSKILEKNKKAEDDIDYDEEESDIIALIGHQVATIDDLEDIGQYFKRAYKALKPKGQILLTSICGYSTKSISINNDNSKFSMDTTFSYGIKSEHGFIYGPYYGMFNFNNSVVSEQISTIKLNIETINENDKLNYTISIR